MLPGSTVEAASSSGSPAELLVTGGFPHTFSPLNFPQFFSLSFLVLVSNHLFSIITLSPVGRKSLVGGPRKQGNKRENASTGENILSCLLQNTLPGDNRPGARLSRGGPSRLPKLSQPSPIPRSPDGDNNVHIGVKL